MPKFRYKAVSLTGEHTTGEYTAADEASVSDMLRQGGYYPESIKMIAKDASFKSVRIPVKALSGFSSQMATLMRAGVPISKSLEILTAQQEHLGFRKILEDVYSAVLRGVSLSEAFIPHEKSFPSLFINMIEAGEASGTLDSCMERAGQSFFRLAKLNNKVKNAMIYPIVILVVLIGLLIVMMAFILPMFAGMFEDAGAELPGFTQGLLGVSSFVVNRWFVIVGVVAFIVIGFKWWKGTPGGTLTIADIKLGFPKVGKLIAKVYAARFARTLASLTASGVPLTQGLAVTARSVLNARIEKELYMAIEGINRGELLSTQLEMMNRLPMMITYMVRLGEESGTLEELLNQAADYYDEESESALQAMTSMLEPMLIVLMAIIVVPILIAVLLPMLNMSNMMMGM